MSIRKWINYVSQLPYLERRKEINQKLNPPLCRHLFKYVTVDPSNRKSIKRVEDIIVNSRLWLSSPEDFNDPFDMSASIVTNSTSLEKRNKFEDILKRRGFSYKERKALALEYVKNMDNNFESVLGESFRNNIGEFGVFSFAGDCRNILMWSHYAGDHTGICIVFERARDFMVLSGALSVKYDSDYPVINWITDAPEKLGDIMLQKHVGWRYENEHRIVIPERARTYIPFRSDAITGIILGCKAPNEVRVLVSKILKRRRRKGLSEIKLYTAVQHKNKYRLVIRRA